MLTNHSESQELIKTEKENMHIYTRKFLNSWKLNITLKDARNKEKWKQITKYSELKIFQNL